MFTHPYTGSQLACERHRLEASPATSPRHRARTTSQAADNPFPHPQPSALLPS
jgi:hypothetical protein